MKNRAGRHGWPARYFLFVGCRETSGPFRRTRGKTPACTRPRIAGDDARHRPANQDQIENILSVSHTPRPDVGEGHAPPAKPAGRRTANLRTVPLCGPNPPIQPARRSAFSPGTSPPPPQYTPRRRGRRTGRRACRPHKTHNTHFRPRLRAARFFPIRAHRTTG